MKANHSVNRTLTPLRTARAGYLKRQAEDLMHFHVRLMRGRAQEIYAEIEARELRELLETAPGVQRIKSVERHPKGGYSITLDFSYDAFDAFINRIVGQDWMPVV